MCVCVCIYIYIYKLIYFYSNTIMNRKSVHFRGKNIKTRNFCKSKKLFKIDEIDVNKILVSEEEPYGTKKVK